MTEMAKMLIAICSVLSGPPALKCRVDIRKCADSKARTHAAVTNISKEYYHTGGGGAVLALGSRGYNESSEYIENCAVEKGYL